MYFKILFLATIHLSITNMPAHAQLGRVIHPDDLKMITVTPGVQLKELTGASADAGAKSKQASVALFRLEPGHASAWSHNKIGEESFFVLKGHGEVWIGRKKQPVRPGSFILIPPAAVRSIRAARDEALEYYAITTPAWTPEDDVHVPAPKGAPQ